MKRELFAAARKGLVLAAAIACIACCWMFFTPEPEWLFDKANETQHANLIILMAALAASLLLRLLRPDL